MYIDDETDYMYVSFLTGVNVSKKLMARGRISDI